MAPKQRRKGSGTSANNATGAAETAEPIKGSTSWDVMWSGPPAPESVFAVSLEEEGKRKWPQGHHSRWPLGMAVPQSRSSESSAAGLFRPWGRHRGICMNWTTLECAPRLTSTAELNERR